MNPASLLPLCHCHDDCTAAYMHRYGGGSLFTPRAAVLPRRCPYRLLETAMIVLDGLGEADPSRG